MKSSKALLLATLAVCVATLPLVDARQQGQGQLPSPLPLSLGLREKGSSVSPAFEGWYRTKDGGLALLVGYFNRNSRQEFDIPVGPNNRIEPGGPDMGQPTHFQPGRQWGIFSIKLPKDFGEKKLTWTIVANGFSNTITLHTKLDYILDPFEDPANKNTPPSLRFAPAGPAFLGPPAGIAASLTAAVGEPLSLTAWATDAPPKVNVPATFGRATAGRGTAGRPTASLKWSMFRGPAEVTFDPFNPRPDPEKNGESVAKTTFSVPGEYILRLQANDSTGEGGGGFQCCWTNAHVKVTVKSSSTN
jgi:hypothetical protein